MRQAFVLITLVLINHAAVSMETARGVVYADTNRNGVHDEGEPGVVKVLITNQRDFAETSTQGVVSTFFRTFSLRNSLGTGCSY